MHLHQPELGLHRRPDDFELNDLHMWVDSYTQGTLISPAMQQQRLQWIPAREPHIRYGLGIGYFNGWLRAYGRTARL